jgi:poly(hydroxyalkanoate) granule-associated protein
MAEKKEKGKGKVDESILDAANKIWMAGLGAVQTAEKEGSKLFKSLVDKGVDFQSMRREVSQKQLDKISSIVKGGVGSVKGKIDDITQQKEGVWDKFRIEQTISSVMKTFGVATKKEIDSLTKKIDALSKTVGDMKPGPEKKAAAQKTSAKKAPAKAAPAKAVAAKKAPAVKPAPKAAAPRAEVPKPQK